MTFLPVGETSSDDYFFVSSCGFVCVYHFLVFLFLLSCDFGLFLVGGGSRDFVVFVGCLWALLVPKVF